MTSPHPPGRRDLNPSALSNRSHAIACWIVKTPNRIAFYHRILLRIQAIEQPELLFTALATNSMAECNLSMRHKFFRWQHRWSKPGEENSPPPGTFSTFTPLHYAYSTMKPIADICTHWVLWRTNLWWRSKRSTPLYFRGSCQYRKPAWRQIRRWWRISGRMDQTCGIASASAIFLLFLRFSSWCFPSYFDDFFTKR